MFILDNQQELSLNQLGQIIRQFQYEKAAMDKFYNYYVGNQEIQHRVAVSKEKPNNKLMVNYCNGIVNNFLGYMVGKDITYSSVRPFQNIQQVLNYNDVHQMDTELLRTALIMGRACELLYIDEDSQIRFKNIDPRNCIPVYDNSINQNLIYAIRYYPVPDLDSMKIKKFVVEVYDDVYCRIYHCQNEFAGFELVDEYEHNVGQVPVSFFDLNPEQQSIFAQIISLQNAYNDLLSDEVNEYESFCNAYLVWKGAYPDEEQINEMKRTRSISMDEDADVSYLTKSISDTQIQNLLNNLDEKIHTIANSPDFSQESFGTSSGIALRFRLLGFENTAGAIEARMKLVLQRRLELISNIMNERGDDTAWRDVNIIFTRNLPIDLNEVVNVVSQLQGIISDETLISLLPFVDDAGSELKKLKAQKEEEKLTNPFLNRLTNYSLLNDQEGQAADNA